MATKYAITLIALFSLVIIAIAVGDKRRFFHKRPKAALASSLCGENEEWNECGICGQYCPGIKSRCTVLTGCRAAQCFCKPGFVRNILYKCVPPEDCHKYKKKGNVRKCEINEVFSECPKAERHCLYPNAPAGEHCRRVNCWCPRSGFARNTQAVCVPLKSCIKPGTIVCKDEEEYTSCVLNEHTCDNLDLPVIRKCLRKGCWCARFTHARNSTGDCIPKMNCPKKKKT